jgi:DNA invertase Pin-like site-specific DNA recombinase
MGTFFFHMMAAMAQMERELTSERTRAGLAAARARGRRGGRRRALSARDVQRAAAYFAQGLGATEIAAILGVSVPTIYRAVPPEQRQVDAFASPTLM